MSRAAIVGAGPAGLAAAERLAEAGITVEIFDRMPSPGRKLLMAGRGGLNLTHSEPLPGFLARYGAEAGWLAPFIAAFPPAALRDWCAGLGQETFTGSSGRVFPVGLKASPLLRAWLARLAAMGVRLHTRRRWLGWDETGALRFDGAAPVAADVTVLALGGASWPRLGSDGGWAGIVAARGVRIVPLRPANCGFHAGWSDVLRRFAGTPLKRIALHFEGRTVRGEAVLTETGIEGGAVYALSAALREAIAALGAAVPDIDLRPDLDEAALAARLAAPRRGQSLSTFLRKQAGLAPVAIALLREAGPPPDAPAALAARIRRLPLRLTGIAGLERAISSAGGIARDELDARLMLRRLPGTFAAGEMLDWEAPTGGYLLQACLATGRAAADGARAWLAERAADQPTTRSGSRSTT
jgi:uncharacterized flavoprotein (TIGR03862 family)